MAKPTEMEERVAKAICCPHSECRRKFGCTALYENRIQARAAIKAMREPTRGKMRFSDALGHMRDGLPMRRAEWPAHLHTRIPEDRLVILLCRGDEPGVRWLVNNAQILADDWEVHDECAE